MGRGTDVNEGEISQTPYGGVQFPGNLWIDTLPTKSLVVISFFFLLMKFFFPGDV